MRIEHVDVDDDLADAADKLWPHRTWSEVIDHGLRLAVERRRAEDTAAEQQRVEEHRDEEGPGDHEQRDDDEPRDHLEQRFAAAFTEPTLDDLEQRITAALGNTEMTP